MWVGSIFWKNIKPTDKVVSRKTHWSVGKKIVDWTSRDAYEAQTWLRNRAKKDKKKR